MLFEICNPKFMGYARNYLKNHEDAKDVTQEAWRVIVKKLDQLKNEESFVNWAYKILNRKCYDHFRQKIKKEKLKDYQSESIIIGNETNGSEFDEFEELERVIQKLPAEKRAVVFLRFYENFTYKEISEIIKIPEGTIKSKLSRTLKTLREMMKGI